MKKILLILSLLCVSLYTPNLQAERVGGPGVITFEIKGDEEKLFSLYLKPDMVHRFIGRGDTGQVNYYVYDPNNKLVVADMEMGSDCNLEFIPKLPGKYHLLASNYSDATVSVVVRTN